MKIGQLSQDVRILATGFTREAGGTIAENEIPPALWIQWVEEGIIILPNIPYRTKTEAAKIKRRKKAIR